jgi:hypothetical protein
MIELTDKNFDSEVMKSLEVYSVNILGRISSKEIRR